MDVLKKFSGTWNLVDMYVKEGNQISYPLGPQPKGILIYNTDGYMSVVLTGQNRPAKQSIDFTLGSAEEQLVLIQYASYNGSFQIYENKNVITHNVNISIFPKWEKTELKRSYAFCENKLTLTTIPTKEDSINSTDIFTLLWEKV
ncbi:lipocalin-like domain-containing protein [Bacillus cereus]|uniref:lipocalin-like domain-containing protein n=1 Tax=Bacillus cereus TaxID=1396 RepID=UPI000C284ED2|nr:lipocalin-like domain-containing protein [Bacillus cereus]